MFAYFSRRMAHVDRTIWLCTSMAVRRHRGRLFTVDVNLLASRFCAMEAAESANCGRHGRSGVPPDCCR